MADIKTRDTLFFDKTGMDKGSVSRIVSNALQGCDDGEPGHRQAGYRF